MNQKRSSVPAQYTRLNSTGSAEGGGVGYPNMRLAGNQTSQNQDPKSQPPVPPQLGGPGGFGLPFPPQGRSANYYRPPSQQARMQPPRQHPQNPPISSSPIFIQSHHPQYMINTLNNVVVRINQPQPYLPGNYQHQSSYVFPNYDFSRGYAMTAPTPNAAHVNAQPQSQPHQVAGGGNGPTGMATIPGMSGSIMPSLPQMQHVGSVAAGMGGNIHSQAHVPGHQMPVSVSSGAPPPVNQKKQKDRSRAMKIIDPLSGVDVIEKMKIEESEDQTPTDSSTSHSPQSQTTSDSEVASRIQCEFALKVAASVRDENGNSNVSNRLPEVTGPTVHIEQKPLYHSHQLPHAKEQGDSPPLPSSTVIVPPSPPVSPLVSLPVTNSAPATLPSSTPTSPFQPVEDKLNGPTVPTYDESPETEVPKPKVEQPLPAPAPQREIPRVSAKGLLSSETATTKSHSSVSHSNAQQPMPAPPSSVLPNVTSGAPQRKPQTSGDSKSTKQEKKQPSQPKESRGPFPPPSSSRPGPGSTPPPVAKVVVGPPPGLAPSATPSAPTSSVAPAQPATTSSSNFEKLINFSITSVPPMSQPPQQVSTTNPTVSVEEVNGETDNHDSSTAQVGKASQRQKVKKQKKDLNRKGQEKEGTEMDAFTDSNDAGVTAPSDNSTVEKPSANARASTPIGLEGEPDKAENETEATRKEDVPSSNNVDESVPENDEYATVKAADVESNVSNEINSSPSDNNNNGREENMEVSDLEVEDSGRGDKSKQSVKLNYKEGQWSPSNPGGKKVYDRGFLLEVKVSELASIKPNILPDLEILKDKPNETSHNNRRNLQSSSMSGRGDSYNFRGSPSQRGSAMNMKGNRGPQQLGRMSGSMGGPMGGGPRGMGNKMGHQFNSISLNAYPPQAREELLHTNDNRWEPQWKGSDMKKTKEERRTENLLKAARGILNKLTPQKFDVLLKQFMELPIDTEERLIETVILVFKKAVDEPSFSVEYANLCYELQKKEVPASVKTDDEDGNEVTKAQPKTFRKILLQQCQAQFEKNEMEELNIEARNKEIEECTDPEKKKELKLLFEEDERRMRRKSVGLVRFIGELYKQNMLTSNIMNDCIATLLEKTDEESLECLCKLLTTIGKILEEKVDASKFNEYFNQMGKLTQKTAASKVSSRIRFMLQDVIELRARHWVPRRDENAPKTLDQIQKDADRERELSDRQLSNPMPVSMNYGMRGKQQMMIDDRRRGQRNQNDSEWQTITNKRVNYNVDSSKLPQTNWNTQEVTLGRGDAFKNWGSGAGSVSNNSSSSIAMPRTSNKYSALSSQGGMIGRGKLGPSVSMEREKERDRERALNVVKETIGGNSDRRGGNSNVMSSRPGSGPPSRESSRPRYGEPGSSLAGSIGHDRFPSSFGWGTATTAAGGLTLSATSSSTTTSSSPASTVKGPQLSNANTPSSGSPTPPEANARTLSPEEYERSSRTIIDEWCAQLSKEQETIDTLKERFDNDIAPFVRHSLEYILENPKNHAPFCKLLVTLVRKDVLKVADVVNEYSSIMEMASDLIVDIPHLWKYYSNLIAPVIAGDVFTFAHVRQMCQENTKEDLSMLLVKIVQTLLNEKSTKWIRSKWDASNVQLEEFLPEGRDVSAFLKENKIEFLVGEVTEGDEPPSDKTGETPGGGSGKSLTPREIEDKLVSILESDSKNTHDIASNWIKNNVTEKDGTKDLNFIRTLTRAVLKASTSSETLSNKFETSYSKLLRFYVDNDEACELACLQTIQRLMVVELSASSNVIKALFSTLNDTGTISKNGFFKWKQVSEKEEGRGVIMTALTAFFTELTEDGSEESSDES